MGRGRKSRLDELSGGPVIPGVLPPPPSELEEDEKLEWLRVTASLPSDWFDGSNMAMLIELCRHICYAREHARQIVALRKKFIADGKDVLTDAEYIERVGSLRAAHGFQSDRINRLSTKLRLSQKSRYGGRADAAGRATREPTSRPWDDWGGDDDPRRRQ